MIKRLIKVSVGVTRLTPSELQTVLFEVANLSNDRPIGVNRSPEADGTYHVLTPNCLLQGRSQHWLPDDAELVIWLLETVTSWCSRLLQRSRHSPLLDKNGMKRRGILPWEMLFLSTTKDL